MLVLVQAIRTKSVVTNRAPVMNLWAMVVCERLGFQRAAALSICKHTLCCILILN